MVSIDPTDAPAMNYSQFHHQFLNLAPRQKNPTIDRIIPVDEGGQNLDIRLPVVKGFVKKFFKENKLTFSETVSLADEIFQHKITEEIAFAIELTARYREARELIFFEHAAGWIKFLTNWENCDRLCGQILGKILLKNPLLLPEIKQWAKSKFYWQRRCAVVVFIPALSHEGRRNLYKKSKFVKRCLEICGQLGQDQEKYVQKAVGWPIREITKWQGRQITYPWLLKNKHQLSSFVWHAALEKFSSQDKKALKKAFAQT